MSQRNQYPKLVLDPGVTTGYCLGLGDAILGAGTVQKFNELWELLNLAVIGYEVNAFIAEDFQPHLPLVSHQVTTIQVCGIIKLAGLQYQIPVIWQRPEDRHPFLERARQVIIGGYDIRSYKTPHIVDAAAHYFASRATARRRGLKLPG